jgi:CRISPR-associated protein Csb2
MLVLEIELLTGVYRAALPDGSGAEWPPHPERVFSALAQAWGDGGCDPKERAALEWLERQAPPVIGADGPQDWAERTAPTVFVPPNDSRGSEIAVLPDRRRRQGRSFRAAIPINPVIQFTWAQAVFSADYRAALTGLAQRVASLGHSASLVRCAFLEEAQASEERQQWEPSDAGAIALRVPYAGRLGELVRWHEAEERPRSGTSARYRTPGVMDEGEAPTSLFGGPDEWFVFESEDVAPVDLLAFAHVAQRVRDSLMSHAEPPVSEALSGHTADGSPTARVHVAIVPLANVGWEHATGDLLGFAVVLPRDLARDGRRAQERMSVTKALAAFASLDAEEAAQRALIKLGAAGVWRLTYSVAPSRFSLRPGRWCGTSKVWASATPALLDRFPDQGDIEEEARLVATACTNIGLPEPIEIELHKHSAVRGAPSAYPARGDRRRPDWSFPRGAKFANRPRRHVVLHFAEPVTGPVIIGAGRFRGFGLCLPELRR